MFFFWDTLENVIYLFAHFFISVLLLPFRGRYLWSFEIWEDIAFTVLWFLKICFSFDTPWNTLPTYYFFYQFCCRLFVSLFMSILYGLMIPENMVFFETDYKMLPTYLRNFFFIHFLPPFRDLCLWSFGIWEDIAFTVLWFLKICFSCETP